jgi:hypothetical protein
MLFDLRGRGRRRTVQAIYLSLALLMGGGLVLFGIGGNVDGGLLNAFQEKQQQTDDAFQKRLERAEATARARPQDAKAWAAVARLRYQVAGTGENYDQNNRQFTDKGRAKLVATQQAWDKYLDLAGKKPDASVASLMVQAFSGAGLNKPEKAVEAMEIVVDNQGEQATPALYVQLAALAFQARQTRKGDLAAKKAISLAPKDDKEQIRAQVQAARNATAVPVNPDDVGAAANDVSEGGS